MIFLNFSEMFGKYGIVNQLILSLLLLFISFASVFVRLLNKIFKNLVPN